MTSWRDNIDKIHPEFFTGKLEGFTVKEKMIIHEYAKKRWGVFEEHGYPGDPHFPLLYLIIIYLYSINWLPSVKRIDPDYSSLAGTWHTEDVVTGGECLYEADEAPHHNCRLIIDDTR